MAILTVLGLLTAYAANNAYHNSIRKEKPFTYRELKAMSYQMIGKNKKECSEILKRRGH